jgi:small conductance mechanosensitive channel
MLNGTSGKTHDAVPVEQLPAQPPRKDLEAPSTMAEGGLSSEAGVIEEQARHVQPLNDGENLLKVASGTPSAEERAKSHDANGKESGK